MESILIKNAQIVNEGKIIEGDVYIKYGKIYSIGGTIDRLADMKIDARGRFLLPGVIDDQVHFREPGLTHKADIGSESSAAVAGGITSFMEMPNTQPQTVTQELLQDKYDIAARTSAANYSFYMGATNDNLDEVLRTDPEKVCGVKIFMGSSTGNMLVDNPETLAAVFKNVPMLIATHCEQEEVIRQNLEIFKGKYGDDIPMECHPEIRSHEACYLSSSSAVELAKKYGTRLHILHISTADETNLFRNDIPLEEKLITAEVCIHHLWFESGMYSELGTRIKWNPAVKTADDRDALWEALLDDRMDVIATDHAPHTVEEKDQVYTKAPSGGPLVQHALPAMLEKMHEGKISLERVVEKMCHAPATCFRMRERGFIREDYFADLVLIENQPWTVSKDNILYKCGWSPFEGQRFNYGIATTIVSGKPVWHDGRADEQVRGMRLEFEPRR